MEIKMKEKVDINTFTFKKRVIDETLELLGDKYNYVLNDIYFTTMVTFLNSLVENNLILDSLSDEKKLEHNMYSIVEPMFKKEVLDIPERYDVYEDIVMQIEQYLNREVELNKTISGLIHNVYNVLGNMSIPDVLSIINNTIDQANTIKKSLKSVDEETDQKIETEVKKDIEDLKMQAFIEQFKKKADNTQEEIKDAE